MCFYTSYTAFYIYELIGPIWSGTVLVGQFWSKAVSSVIRKYITHLYCLAMQASFYSDADRVQDFQSSGPGSIPVVEKI